MNSLRQQAERLRAQGYSYNLIHQKLGVPKSTMSYWFKDKPFTPNSEVLKRIETLPSMTGINKHNARVEEIKILRQAGIDEVGHLTQRDLWMLGLGLYIGEGSKTTETIRIVNSDPAVIKIAVEWLREVCRLDTDNITIAVHLYPDNNIEDSVQYWQSVTGLPRRNFRKTQVDTRTNKSLTRKRRLPYGTAHVTVVSNGDPRKGVKLYRRLDGWIAGALRKI